MSEMARENRKSGKENVELGTQEREASQGRQVLQKGKKKASSVLSFEEEMETSSQRPGEASLKASKARPTRPSTAVHWDLVFGTAGRLQIFWQNCSFLSNC